MGIISYPPLECRDAFLFCSTVIFILFYVISYNLKISRQKAKSSFNPGREKFRIDLFLSVNITLITINELSELFFYNPIDSSLIECWKVAFIINLFHFGINKAGQLYADVTVDASIITLA